MTWCPALLLRQSLNLNCTHFFCCQFLTASDVSFVLEETALKCLSGIHLPFSPTALPPSSYRVTYNFSSPCLPFQRENQLSTAFVLLSWHRSLHGSPNSVSYRCRFLSWHLVCTLLCRHHKQHLPGISIVIHGSQENLHNMTVWGEKKLLAWNLICLQLSVIIDQKMIWQL